MFFDQDGTLQVYMVGQKEPVNEAMMAFMDDVIAREVGGGERLSSSGIETLEGQYGFLDLHRWQQQMSPDVLALPGVVFTDIDETRIGFGSESRTSPGVTEEVEEYLSKMGVPREAVRSVKPSRVVPDSEVAVGRCAAVCKSTSAVSYARSVLSLPPRRHRLCDQLALYQHAGRGRRDRLPSAERLWNYQPHRPGDRRPNLFHRRLVSGRQAVPLQ